MRTITTKPFSLFVWILGITLAISLIFLWLTPAQADPPLDTDISAQATFPSHPLNTPANGATSHQSAANL